MLLLLLIIKGHIPIGYVPFNSLNFSEGNMPVYDLNTESKRKPSPALWKMIQKTKSPTKPSWRKTIALTSTTSGSQPTFHTQTQVTTFASI